MFLVYFIIVFLMFCIISIETHKEGLKFYIPVTITSIILIIIITIVVISSIDRKANTSDNVGNDYKFDKIIVPTVACNTTNINNYFLLMDSLRGGLNSIQNFTALGECNLVKDYIKSNKLIDIVKTTKIIDIYIIKRIDELRGIFDTTDLNSGITMRSNSYDKKRIKNCDRGGLCNYRESNSYMFKAANDYTYFYDFEDYDSETDKVVYYRSVNVKLTNTQCITKIFILGNVDIDVIDCVDSQPDDFDVGDTPECYNNIITTPDPESRNMYTDFIYYGEELFTCYGIIYLMDQIIRKEGICRAIKILNSKIDIFGFGIAEYTPFVFRYDKLIGEVFSVVDVNTEYAGLSMKSIYMNILNSSVDSLDDETAEKVKVRIKDLMRSDFLSIFIDSIDGKNVDEVVNIHNKSKKPVIYRTLTKIYNIENDPYNYYFFGCGYTLQYIPYSTY